MEGSAKNGTQAGEDSPLLNTEEAARFLRLSPATIANDRVVRRMKIPYRRLGRRVVYHRDDLCRWLDGQRVTEAA